MSYLKTAAARIGEEYGSPLNAAYRSVTALIADAETATYFLGVAEYRKLVDPSVADHMDMYCKEILHASRWLALLINQSRGEDDV